MRKVRDIKWFVLRYSVLIVALAISLAGVFFSVQGLIQQRELIEKESRINIWFLAQTEIEFIRFTESLKDYSLTPGTETSEIARERFEIFWSRLLPLLEGRQTAELRAIDGMVPLAKGMIDELEDLEPLIYSLETLSNDELAAIHLKLDTLRTPVHDMVRRGLLYESGEVSQTRERHNELYEKLIGLFGLILLGGFAILVILFLQIVKTNRAVQEKDQSATEAIRARKELELAINSISEGFIVFDQNDRVEIFNQRYVDLHPMQADDLVVGVTFQDLLRSSVRNGGVKMPEDEVEAWVASISEKRRASQSATFESRLSNGVWLHINERWTSDGRLVGVHSDITELKEREQLVNEKSELLQTTLDNMKHGIAVFDEELNLRLFNQRYLEINRYPTEIVDASRSYRELASFAANRGDLGPGDPDTLVDSQIAGIRELLRAGSGGMRQVRRLGDDRDVETLVAALPTGGFVKTYEDITDRLAAETEKSRLTEMYHAAQRTQALGTLAGGMAHDFNNIIGGIIGNCALLVADLPNGSPAQKRVKQILDSGTHARDLVRQILTYSRNAGSDRKPLDLELTVHDSVTAMISQLPTNVVVKTGHLAPCVVEADSTQLHQALLNIVMNAAQAIGKETRGQITISMDVVDQTAGGRPPGGSESGEALVNDRSIASHTNDLAPGRYARISIKDTGPGIADEVMPRIFEPFYTTKQIGEGTGLGLAAVQGIVRNHDGAIVVESVEGVGTRFDLYFPLKEGAVTAEAPTQKSPLKVGAGSEHLMLIDDDSVLLSVTCEMLARQGYKVDAYGEAEKAIDAFRNTPEAWDLVITDRKMPRVSGEDVAVAVKATRADIPILMLTGFATLEEVEHFEQHGVNAVVGKPVLPEELSAAVASVLGRGESSPDAEGMERKAI